MNLIFLSLFLSFVLSFTTYRTLQAQTPSTSPLTEITLDGQKLYFFPEVLEILEGIAHPPPTPPRAPRIQEQIKCSSLKKFQEKKFSCSLPKKVTQSLSEALPLCEQVYSPLKYIQSLKPTRPLAGKSRTIEGIIRLIGNSMNQTQLPPFVTTQNYRKLTENILLKVRSKKIQKGLRRALKKVTKNADPNCLQQVKTEIQDALNDLQKVLDEGELQAHLDQNKVLHTGRKRNLKTSLTDEELKWMALAIGAGTWRIRGGGGYSKVYGTQFLRVQFLLHPFTALATTLSQSRARLAGPALYARIFKGYSEYFGMGRTGGPRTKYEDHAGMVRRGKYQVKWAVSLLKRQGYDTTPLKQAGRQMGHCYYYAWEKLRQREWGDHLRPPLHGWVNKGDTTAWGELCTGAALGLGLAKTLLGGYQ